jgi:hypothetical protein
MSHSEHSRGTLQIEQLNAIEIVCNTSETFVGFLRLRYCEGILEGGMVISVKERKERREVGRQKELDEMSVAKKVQRNLTNGRPPASELKTPNAALTAARTLHREIGMRIADETHGTRPRATDYFAVAVGYVTPDLSVLGFSPLYAAGEEDRIERALTGNIALGLVFGIADGSEVVMGARPFLVTKQTEAWLSELMMVVKSEIELDRMERQ